MNLHFGVKMGLYIGVWPALFGEIGTDHLWWYFEYNCKILCQIISCN